MGISELNSTVCLSVQHTPLIFTLKNHTNRCRSLYQFRNLHHLYSLSLSLLDDDDPHSMLTLICQSRIDQSFRIYLRHHVTHLDQSTIMITLLWSRGSDQGSLCQFVLTPGTIVTLHKIGVPLTQLYSHLTYLSTSPIRSYSIIVRLFNFNSLVLSTCSATISLVLPRHSYLHTSKVASCYYFLTHVIPHGRL